MDAEPEEPQPSTIPVPEVFWSFETDAPLRSCLICVKDLIESGESFPHFYRANLGTKKRGHWTVARFPTWPRRESALRVKGTVGNEDFDLLIANPRVHSATNRWTPTPLPTTNTLGDLEIVLARDSLELRQADEHTQILAAHPKIFRGERDVSGEFQNSPFIADETGNRGRIRIPTNEPVWQVQIDLWQKPPWSWNTNQTLSLDVPAFPARDRVFETNVVQSVNGVGIQKIWLMPTGLLTLPTGSTYSSPHPGIRVFLDGAYRDKSLLMTLTQGTNILGQYTRPARWIGTVANIWSLSLRTNEIPSGPFELKLSVQDPLRTSIFIDPKKIPR